MNFTQTLFCILLALLANNVYSQTTVATHECNNWEAQHPEWIFCDDFESGLPLVKSERYFEVDHAGGRFTLVNNIGINSSSAMRAIWQTGDVNAGNLKLGFGRNPVNAMNQDIRSAEDFREIYYRMFVKMQSGWQGNPFKLSRASVISGSDWSQAMIAHIWQGSGKQLSIDPARCVGTDNLVKCSGYNDFANLEFLGQKDGSSLLFETAQADQWRCVEAHVKLNDAGQSNGIQEFWVDDNLEVSSSNVDFVRSYNDYAINTVFFENYWNGGSPKSQERYFDNIVVSTQRIGCTSPADTNTETAATASSTASSDNSGSGGLHIYSVLLLLLASYKRKALSKA